MSFSDSELSKILPTNGPDINEAKKYLNKYKNESICIKIGGSVLNDKSLFNILIEDISLLSKINFNPIIIHGGGKRLTNKLNELNIKTNFINGLRVTNQKVINIVENVFIEFNKEIVTALRNKSSRARSINSKENNIINVKSVSKELGFVGTPNKIDVENLKKIVLENEIPVAVSLQLNGSKLAICSVTVQPATLVVTLSISSWLVVIFSEKTVKVKVNVGRAFCFRRFHELS